MTKPRIDPIPAPRPLAVVHGQLSHGGSERQLYLLLAHCDRTRWQPQLYLSGAAGVWEAPIRALDIPITVLQGNPAQKMWQFRQLCQATKIRHLLSWGAYTNGYALALAGLNALCIGSFRNAHFSDLPERHRWLWAWSSLAGVSTLVCNSRETVASLQVRVGEQKRLVYIPNAMEPLADAAAQRAHWRQQLGIAEDAILVVGVGRLTPQKNFARFIDALVIAQRSQPLYGVIAGPDMGLGEALRQQILATGLPPETLQLIGPVADARTLICAADIFLLTSDYEGMPNVVLEAMAAAVPCVSTPVNGINALIEPGVHGFVAEPYAGALAEAVVRLARDPQLRAEIGANARAKILREYSPAVIMPQFWQLFEESAE